MGGEKKEESRGQLSCLTGRGKRGNLGHSRNIKGSMSPKKKKTPPPSRREERRRGGGFAKVEGREGEEAADMFSRGWEKEK